VADRSSKRRTLLIRGLVLAVVAALTIAVAPGGLMPVVAGSWLVVWFVGLVASLGRRPGTWRVRLAAFGVAVVVLAFCRWLPVKYVDGVVGPATYPEMTLRELGGRMARDGILPPIDCRPGWCERKISVTIDRPMSRRAVVRKLAEDLDARASFGRCGTGDTILWGGHPMRLYIRPKDESRRKPRAAPARVAFPGGGVGVLRDAEFNFEIAIPSDEWMELPLSEDESRAHVRARLHAEWAHTDPPATCDINLMVVPLTRRWARQSPDEIAMQWQPQMEGGLSSPRELKHGEAKLGGQDCYYRDVKGEHYGGVGHVTWYLGKMGDFAYTLHVSRTCEAVGNTQLEREIREIIDSFKYLEVIEIEAEEDEAEEAFPEAGRIDAESVKRRKITRTYWRLEAVKPKDVLNIDPQQFSKRERANNVIAKFQRRLPHSFLQIRIYAQSATSQRYTLDQLARNTLQHWEKIYSTRLEPEIDEEYEFPMAERAIKMRLVGRRTVPETYTWILAQCTNDRQYRISVYTTGATGERVWKAQIEDFLENLRPLKK
jgi:hypothetical protein